ncbi:MAG: hypothetical protein IGS03_02755 [Candidatus Sericytochromatia bacterium]|nr:hypothetical protein [Candidatus Sericytochromatia bacterium]
MACSGGVGLSQADKDYYQDLKTVHKELKSLQNFVDSSRFIKVRYEEALNKMITPTQEVLRKYKGSDFEQRSSYQNTFRAFESYVVAKGLWDQNKGMTLVNQRLAEAKNQLQQAETSAREEQKPAQ